MVNGFGSIAYLKMYYSYISILVLLKVRYNSSMNNNSGSKSIDTLLEDFVSKKAVAAGKGELAPITVWVPLESKLKYDALQERSHRRFAKTLREVMSVAIDRASGKAS